MRGHDPALILACPGRKASFHERKGICFIGSYLHQPNIDAVCYFLDEIWPLVLELVPDCVFGIVGSDLPPTSAPVPMTRSLPSVMWRHRQLPQHRPSDRRPSPLRSRRQGQSGLQPRQRRAVHRHCDCRRGYGLVAGDAIAVADDAIAFATEISRLYSDETAWTRMSDLGWRYVAREYSVEAGRERVRDLLRTLGLPHPPLAEVKGTARRRRRATLQQN